MLLARKVRRELWSEKGQAIAVLAVMSLGVLLFVATAGAYLDLRNSYAHTQSELALAALHIDVRALSVDELPRIRALPAIRTIEARVVTALPVDIVHGRGVDRVDLRVISIPPARQPTLDRLLLVAGRLPAAPDDVVLEKHFATHHYLVPGAAVTVPVAGAPMSLHVCGVAVSPEYLWVARDENDVFPSPDAFGIGWMTRDGLRAAAIAVRGSLQGSAAALEGLDAATSVDQFDQLLVDPARGATDAMALRAITGAIGRDAVVRVTPADRLVGPRLLQMDVDGYKGMAAFFPIFFLGVGAFIVASILARRVDAQRSLIGTFAALGVGRFRILLHYVAYAVVLGGTGAVVGAVGGTFVSPAMTHAYADDLGIPFVVASFHWDLLAWGIVIAFVTSVLSGLAPAVHASRLAPAEAMRPPRPTTGALARLARRIPAPLSVRLAVRDALGRPIRSLGTALGVAAAFVLVLATGAMLDSMRTTFVVLFHDARRYDLRVDLTQPEPSSMLRQRFAHIDGVRSIETAFSAPVSVRARTHREHAFVDGIGANARLLRSIDLDGRVVEPEEDGVVLTRALAHSLAVGIGDNVEMQPVGFDLDRTFRVSGVADGALGKSIVARRDDLARAMGLDGMATSVLLAVSDGRTDDVRRALSREPDVAHIEDAASIREQIATMMSLGWVMIGVMLLCSVVLAASILFNTATLGILERRRELATLRALGRTIRELAIGLTIEHALLALAGLAIGFPLAVLATKKLLALYSSDLFVFPFVMAPRSVLSAAVGIVLVLLIAQWPALRSLSRASLAEAVRTRDA